MLSLFKKELWTKELTAWYLYDFANSFMFINMTLYFSQWVVVDKGLTDFWYSLPVVVATIFLILATTYFGSIADRKGNHFKIFYYSTLGIFISLAAIIAVGRLLPGLAGPILALILFAIYQFFYQLALVPYSSFIKYISTEDIYGKVSGIGFGFSQFGHIAGLLLTLPITKGIITEFGTDRLSPLIPALIAAIVFFLPSYFAFRKKHFAPVESTEKISWWRSTWDNLKESRRYPGAFPLLLSFYFFSDGILTLSLYSAIYMEKVFQVDDPFKVKIALYITIGFAIGAFLGGAIADRFKHKPILIGSLILCGLSILAIALISNQSLLVPLYLILGFTMGTTFASSRSYYASLIPKERSGALFGLYVFAERFASILGPLVWGVTIFVLKDYVPINYRTAAFMMGLFVLLALIPLVYKRRPALQTISPPVK